MINKVLRFTILIFIIPIFSSCNFINKVKNKEILCKVEVKIVQHNINYEISNLSEDEFFIATNYFLLKDADQFILESYPKSDLINYNQFVTPKLISLKAGESIKGKTSSSQIVTENLYLRIYKSYNSEEKSSINESNFLSYEEKKSVLIKATIGR
jgi:hypothetical protein